ncbi:hypothetical protein C8J57DRAFT_1392448 [Mycena rebaudengoi]|nr:hypothetical protein C8J57DRAFT_1392448 [Mycena rebaudengoi]
MRSLPSLRRFSCNLRYLYNFNIPWHQLTHLYMSDGFDSEGTIHSNLHILSRCPALILCSLGLSSDEDSHPSSYKNPMILSYLESFSIAVRSCRVETADRLFSSLTLPALRALDLQGSGRPSPHVINSFFGRSACPLDTLHLLGSNMPSADLMQWLRPVTKTMDSLTLIVGVHPADDLLRALTRNEEETCLCPNLRSIMFSSSESSWSWTSGLMADMVESRWRDGANSRLQSAYISRYDERRVMNDVDDVPRLQQLKDRGLDITCSGNWGELLTD